MSAQRADNLQLLRDVDGKSAGVYFDEEGRQQVMMFTREISLQNALALWPETSPDQSEGQAGPNGDLRDADRDDATWIRCHVFDGDVADAYCYWPQPDVIVSDGAYGVGGFPGDPRTPEDLQDWYDSHVKEWSRVAHPATTLWFWNTELGWATVHPLLVRLGWEYVQTIVWDKGIAHIAGNVNGDTIRRFPVVTEVCVFYRRRLEFPTTDGGMLAAKHWLRHEWQRAGLSLNKANEACGVRNAATRKYLTQDWLWYFPPADAMAQLVAYANERGRPDGRPYYSIDGALPVTAEEWGRLRDTWTHQHALTNVWTHPPLNGAERYRGNGNRSAPRVYRPGRNATLHLNQKPLEFMRRIVIACSQAGDVLWEPFGGLCSASVAAVELGRDAYAAEVVREFRARATRRLLDARRARERIQHGEPADGPIEHEWTDIGGGSPDCLVV